MGWKDAHFRKSWERNPRNEVGLRRKIVLIFQHKYLFTSRFLKIPKGSLVLDFGCGSGSYTMSLSQDYGFSVVGVDISKNAILIAQKNNNKRRRKCQFVVTDCRNLPFKNSVFHGVISIDAFGHIPTLKIGISEIARVLIRNGVAAVFSESKRSPFILFENYLAKKLSYDPSELENMHVSLYRPTQLKLMFKKHGLRVYGTYHPYLIRFLLYPEWYSSRMSQFHSVINHYIQIVNLALKNLKEKRPITLVFLLVSTCWFYLEIFTLGRFVETAGVFFYLRRE